MGYDLNSGHCVLTHHEMDFALLNDGSYGGMFLHRGEVSRAGLLGKWWTWECACGTSGSRFVNKRSARAALEDHLCWTGVNRRR